jgi:hypothetical protein
MMMACDEQLILPVHRYGRPTQGPRKIPQAAINSELSYESYLRRWISSTSGSFCSTRAVQSVLSREIHASHVSHLIPNSLTNLMRHNGRIPSSLPPTPAIGCRLLRRACRLLRGTMTGNLTFLHMSFQLQAGGRVLVQELPLLITVKPPPAACYSGTSPMESL